MVSVQLSIDLTYIEQRKINYPINWDSHRIYSWAEILGSESIL